MEEVARVPAAATDIALSVFSGKRTVSGASIRAITNSSYNAATNGIREAMTVLKRGATPDQLKQLDIPKELNSKSKIINTYVNRVFRVMSAEDRVFKSYALRRSLEAQAKVQAMNEARTGAIQSSLVNRRAIELANNPTEAMAAQAVWDADFATFNNPNVVATAVSTARGVAKKHAGGHALDFAADMVMPFVKTPTNVVARMFDYSAGAPVKAGYHTAKALINRSLDAEQQRAISMAIGRGMVGSAIIYLGWKAAEAGIATGTSPADPSQRAINEAAGRQPGAVKIGNEWHRVSPFSPAGNLFTIGATLQRESSRELKDEAKRIGNIAAVGTRTVLEQPMMQGLQETVDALQNPEAKGERVLASQAGSFVPTLVSDVAAATDTVKRETKPESLTSSVGTGFASRIPGLRQGLPERTDVLGRPLEERAKNAVVPTIPSEAKEDSDPLIRELVQQGVTFGRPGKRQGETPDEYRLRSQLTGRLIESAIREAVTDPRYAGLPQRSSGDDIRKLVIEEAVGKARREMNDVLQDDRYKNQTPEGRANLMRSLIDLVNSELAAKPAQ
jgi:hypothetical protein